MIKKFVSMATATLLLVTGLSAIAAAPAIASGSPITDTALTGLTAPVTGATPVTSFTSANSQWTAAVSWTPGSPTTFASGVIYSARVTITPAAGFAVPDNFGTCSVVFTVPGSSSINCNVPPPSTAVIVSATFPRTSGGGGGGGSGTDATLSLTSKIKGVPVVSLGTPGTGPNNIGARGSIHISTAAAADTSNAGSFITNFVTSDSAATKVYVWKHASGQSILSSSNYNGTAAISDGDVFSIYVSASNGSTYLLYAITVQVSANGASPSSSPAPSTPTQTAAEIAAAAVAAAKAAAEAAAAVRAAEVAVAQTKLSTVLRGDKAGTIDEYKAANIAVSTAASLARINAEVLKLSANDRSDFIKIKAIADKIEFDESFFNATARPTLATYVKYEVVGITERILPTVNTKVLELPAAKRIDAAAIKEIVKVESFVDLVANTATRESVTSTRLIEKGLLPADTPYKHSVRSGLAFYPEGSLNTMAKIEAAIKAELVKAGARKAKTAEIREKIAARRR